MPEKKKVKNWLTNMDSLTTSQESVVRIAGKIAKGNDTLEKELNKKPYINTQTATKPIKILCYLSEAEDKKNNNKQGFDIIIEANRAREELDIVFNREFKSLYNWYLYLNHSNSNREKIEEVISEEKDLKGSIVSINELKEYKFSNI